MVHSIILIALGFVLWKFLPGKITATSRKKRKNIDLGFQISGIILMILGAIQLVLSIVDFIAI